MSNSRLSVLAAVALLALVGVGYWSRHSGDGLKPGLGATRADADVPNTVAHQPDSIDLSDSQLSAVKVEPVEERDFPVEKEAVGSINFNQDLEVPVFTPYQGRIIALFAEIGN